MPETISRPYFAEVSPDEPFTPDSDTIPSSETVRRVLNLEEGINADPRHYQRALTALGTLATSSKAGEVVELGLDDETMEAAIAIYTYFAIRGDRSVEYDSATDAYMIRSQRYKDARTTHGAARDKTAEDRTAASDTLRRLTLDLYIARVVEWQDQQSQPQAS